MSETNKIPLGLYTYEDDIPGVESHEIPSNKVTQWAQQGQAWAEKLDDLIPGGGDLWNWTVGHLPFVPDF